MTHLPDDAPNQESTTITIREFDFASDFLAAVELWRNAGSGVRVGRSDSESEIRKKLERDPDLFLVAQEGNRLVGTVIAGFDGRRGLVYHLAVDPGCRQRGLGSRLMEEIETRLVAKGCLRSYLLVTPENEEAMRFYEKRGWHRMEIVTYGKDIA